MLIEVKAPELSESVQSGSLLEWRKQAGDRVARDEVLTDLETDKVILEVAAPAAGVLKEIRMPAGSEVKAGDVLAVIEAEAGAEVSAPVATPVQKAEPVAAPAPEPAPETVAKPKPAAAAQPAPAAASPAVPAARPEAAPAQAKSAPCPPCPPCDKTFERGERRVAMTRLRQRIAERLKEAQNTAAMLTTFNEINMQPVMDLRARYQERFLKEHGVKLGFMSFFTKAVCQALRVFPLVNASIDGRDIVYHDYYDVGVAVSSERGLVVPILRNADRMSFSEIEKQIADFGRRANSLELTLEEMEGGTFTISNGGVFGSLLSTPILNPPQSGVLGLHKIQDRPVAENGQVVIRPMMYVALSYDHRIIDGKEAVSFLRSVKDALEDPARLLLEL
ncbi:MAG: 2-oxoglutarate dehydrogenase complex dihydrolipoyllysine-residue succinyltransferase [Betaproteobacteria bacterium]|nr:2-oxoglutarate dehydrogenase complex dihydrolipoyllysine-residue succinyltransferase [Betaproteobacteria bacterium]